MRILIADDHELFRIGLTEMLDTHLKGLVEFVQAKDFDSCLSLIRTEDSIDLVLVDLGMPGMQGAESIAAITRQADTVPVVIVTASEDGADMVANVQAGVAGYITKSMTAADMTAAIETVLSGGYFITPGLGRATDDKAKDGVASDAIQRITDRQREILALVERGLTNKEIARELDLSPATVKAHVAALLTTLQLKNRTQLAQAAQKIL